MQPIRLLPLFVLGIFFFASNVNDAQAQRYQEFKTEDGVEFSYRWSRSSFFDRSSPLELRLKVQNTNDYPVEVSFQVDFYMGPVVKESSQTTELCIRPKLAKTGRLNGVYYRSSVLSNEEIESDDFEWLIEDLEIKKVEGCS